MKMEILVRICLRDDVVWEIIRYHINQGRPLMMVSFYEFISQGFVKAYVKFVSCSSDVIRLEWMTFNYSHPAYFFVC